MEPILYGIPSIKNVLRLNEGGHMVSEVRSQRGWVTENDLNVSKNKNKTNKNPIVLDLM
jgi:hypothetical protein